MPLDVIKAPAAKVVKPKAVPKPKAAAKPKTTTAASKKKVLASVNGSTMDSEDVEMNGGEVSGRSTPAFIH